MAIQMRVQRETMIKPRHKPNLPTLRHIPLTVFDTVTYNTTMSVIVAYASPTVANLAVVTALEEVLGEYPEWAGRIGYDVGGRPVILLNDKGVRVVEVEAEVAMEELVRRLPSPEIANFHLTGEGAAELLLVQLTRFSCGGLAIGLTAHHLVADGFATSLFWVAWGRAARGLDPLVQPLNDRSIFVPRDPPVVEFEHYGVEYLPPKNSTTCITNNTTIGNNDVTIYRAHFSYEFITKLKVKASQDCHCFKPHSTFQALISHLWRATTIARRLDGQTTTRIRISVNGRPRLHCPNGYVGNLVLWAFPEAEAKDLTKPNVLHSTMTLIDKAVSRVDERYFRSFIDFSEVHKHEELRPTAEMENWILCPNLEVDSWVRFPFYEVDFGSGKPDLFVPSWLPYEGFLLFLPCDHGEGGSVDVLVPLHEENMDLFKKICYDLDL